MPDADGDAVDRASPEWRRVLGLLEAAPVATPDAAAAIARAAALVASRWADASRPGLEGLCLADFLAVADNLVKQADAVKHLHAQAQGEVALREAIQELKVWCLETEFSLFEHKENGKDVVLVKVRSNLCSPLKLPVCPQLTQSTVGLEGPHDRLERQPEPAVQPEGLAVLW